MRGGGQTSQLARFHVTGVDCTVACATSDVTNQVWCLPGVVPRQLLNCHVGWSVGKHCVNRWNLHISSLDNFDVFISFQESQQHVFNPESSEEIVLQFILFCVCFGVKGTIKSWRCASGTLEFFGPTGNGSQMEGFVSLMTVNDSLMAKWETSPILFVAPSIGTLFLRPQPLASSVGPKNPTGADARLARKRAHVRLGWKKWFAERWVRMGDVPFHGYHWLSLAEWLSKIGWCGTIWVFFGDPVNKQTYLRHWIMNVDQSPMNHTVLLFKNHKDQCRQSQRSACWSVCT